jgi:hypothetical protein
MDPWRKVQSEATSLMVAAIRTLPNCHTQGATDAVHYGEHGEAELGLACLVLAGVEQDTPKSFWLLTKAAADLLGMSPSDEIYGDEVAEAHLRAG